MKKLDYLKRIALLMLAAALILPVSSCKKEDKGEQPELPPLESLMMDFSDFSEPPNQTKVIIYTYDNFTHAYTTVAYWNGVTVAALGIPATAYNLMLTTSGSPEYLGNNKWRWTKDFTLDEIDYVATLTAERLNNEEFSMKMQLALASAPLLKITWFDGVCRYDHTHAEWNLYRNEGTQVKVIEVEWNKDYEAETSDLTYTYVEPGMNETGSYITFGIEPGGDYDAYYTISVAAGDINIKWDRTTKAGGIMDPAYFEDSVWHLWNSQLQDDSK